ncbi:Nematode cuticle collagen N-terminal domain containing protein, partial [Aphelenchoides avenae]
MSARVAVTLAITGSAIAIFASLIVVASLYLDINNLYDEVLEEMDEFKDIANDAWRNMMVNRGPSSGVSARPFDSVFRQKR